MTNKVGAKGQVVIDKQIRDRLGVEPGWVALQSVVEDHVEIYFLPPRHRKSLKGILAPHIKASVAPGREWDEARERAREAIVEQSNAGAKRDR